MFFNPGIWAGIAALAYALVGAYVLLTGGGALLRSQILLVVAGGVAWGLSFAQPALTGPLAALPVLAQLLLLFGWYALLHRLLRGPYEQSMPRVVKRLLRLFWAVVVAGSALVLWLTAGPQDTWLATLFNLMIAGVALVCFALSAQLGRDAPIEGRSALRAICAAAALAAGSQATLAIVTAAGAAMPRTLVGVVAACLSAAALLLLFALRLRPQWALAAFVSPEARSYAPRFLGAALILLLALLMLPLFRTLEPGVAQQAALLLVLGAGAPVSALLFSGQLNARLRVFVTKHFLPFRYDYREEWLRLIDTLVSPDTRSPLPERAIQALAQIVGSPAGVLWMRTGEGGPMTPAASWNTRILPNQQILPGDPALAFMLERQWTIDTAELSRRPELYGGLQRPAWLESFPEALLIVPLISNDGVIGIVVLFQSSSSFRLTFEEIDLLRTSGRQVAAFLAQYDADQRLAEGRQFEAFNRLTAFVMHDLKNLIAQQSLMLQNAARHKGNPAFFEDAMATIDNSVARMSKLLQQLQSGDTAGPRQLVRITTVVAEAVERCRGRDPLPVVADEAPEARAWIDRERFATVLAHLIRNAQEACDREGRVAVTVGAGDQFVIITIEDDGCGMDPEFVRTRLFRPFDTTKGSKGMGIGAYQARAFVTDAGGSLQVDSEPGRGTCVTIRLPLGEAEEPAAGG